MIPQSFIQDLLGRVDIVDVVDRHVKLKRAGANYVACCPFHSEKTPSFTVSQTKQFYHCFGCGAHGTAIGFLIEYGGLGFVDAVKDLAQSVGMKVPGRSAPKRAQRTARQEGDDLHARAAQGGAVLPCAAEGRRRRAIDYLKKRGLSGEIAKRFGIGYAPDGWQNLAAAFSDYDGKALAAAGLVKQKDDGRRYDVFRDRIMFPIVDVRGNVIGFGGRVLETGEPEVPQFARDAGVRERARALRPVPGAARDPRRRPRASWSKATWTSSRSRSTASSTPWRRSAPRRRRLHVQKLLRQADEIVFCFDGDAAGRRAAWRALENAPRRSCRTASR